MVICFPLEFNISVVPTSSPPFLYGGDCNTSTLCKDKIASKEFLIHSLFLFKVINKPFVEQLVLLITFTAPKKPALNSFWGFIQIGHQTAARFLPMYIIQNTIHPPPTQRIFQFLVISSEIGYLKYILMTLLLFSKALEGCGVGNKGINFMNFVHLSGIYPIRDVECVFDEFIVIPPGLLFFGSSRRPFMSFKAF